MLQSVLAREPPSTASTVAAELDRICGSPGFGATARTRELLRFLVGEALAGRGADLTERAIAVRFLGRKKDFDAAVDSIVRVEMTKLRRALRVYDETVARGQALRIEFPRGSYAPRFVAGGDEAPPLGGDALLVLPGGPSLALASFTAVDSPREVEDYARELTEQVGVGLGRMPYLRVVRAPAGDPRARQARYGLGGSVWQARGAVRIVASLDETASGTRLWSELFEAPSLAAAEDGLARRIVTHVGDISSGVIIQREAREAGRLGAPVRTPYDAHLRLVRWLSTCERDGYPTLDRAVAAALRAEPDNASLLSGHSIAQQLGAWTGARVPPGAALESARRSSADPSLPGPHLALGFAYLDAGDGEALRREAERVLARGSHSASHLAIAAFLLTLSGAWARGADRLRAELAVLPVHFTALHHALALAAYQGGDFDTALAEARRMGTPSLAWDPLDRAAALGMLGRRAEAAEALAELRRILPAFEGSARAHLQRMTPDPAMVEALLAGLRAAGLRDEPG
jgi:TolB-like protein